MIIVGVSLHHQSMSSMANDALACLCYQDVRNYILRVQFLWLTMPWCVLCLQEVRIYHQSMNTVTDIALSRLRS